MSGTVPRSISVCLPALNEAPNLEAVLREIARTLTRHFHEVEVVVTDDGSTDDTPQVLERLRTIHPGLRVVRHDRPRGYGAACRSALLAARGELLLLTDADGQFDLQDVGPCLEAMRDADAVIGYRVRRRDSWRRVAQGWLWTRLVNLVLGYTARDVNCAFKLVRRDWCQPLLSKVQSDGAAFSAEWMARARRSGVRIREVPVNHRPRRHGRPTGGLPRVMLRGLGELMRVRWSLAERR